MSHDAEAPPPLSLSHGIQLFLLVVAVVAAWIFLCGQIGLMPVFGGFLLLWYWATVEKAAFNRLPASVIGSLAGVGLAWLFVLLPPRLGMMNGLIAAYAVTAFALFLVIMNWLPIAVNGATMLFVTVLGAPALITSINFVQFSEAVVLGAVFFAAVVYAATLYVRMRTKTTA